MPFSGGGSGASLTVNHKHTNLAGAGGSLDSTTLMNDGNLFAQMVAFG